MIFSDEAHFDLGGYVNKQNWCIWGTESHAFKADTSKTRHCLVRILVQGHNWTISLKMSKKSPLQSMAIVKGPCWTNFCLQKLKRRILATFGFNRIALRVTQPMFCRLFLKIALSAAELMSFGYLGAAIWQRWTIICGVPSKVKVLRRQARYNWRFNGQYSWSHWWNTAAHNQ